MEHVFASFKVQNLKFKFKLGDLMVFVYTWPLSEMHLRCPATGWTRGLHWFTRWWVAFRLVSLLPWATVDSLCPSRLTGSAGAGKALGLEWITCSTLHHQLYEFGNLLKLWANTFLQLSKLWCWIWWSWNVAVCLTCKTSPFILKSCKTSRENY